MTITAIWGGEKTGKTSDALTWPAPISLHDWDMRSEGAMFRFIGKDIRVYYHPTPLQLSPGGPLKGFREAWQRFLYGDREIPGFIADLESKEIVTVIMDTGTQAWECCRMGFLQEKQERQGPKEKMRENLLPIEYGEPNTRMKSLIQGARQYGKNLVVTHYEKDEYLQRLGKDGQIEEYRSGKAILDGFKWTEGLVDLVLYSYLGDEVLVENGKARKTGRAVPWAVVTKSGLHIDLNGQKFQEPTYEKIMEMLKMLRGE